MFPVQDDAISPQVTWGNTLVSHGQTSTTIDLGPYLCKNRKMQVAPIKNIKLNYLLHSQATHQGSRGTKKTLQWIFSTSERRKIRLQLVCWMTGSAKTLKISLEQKAPRTKWVILIS